MNNIQGYTPDPTSDPTDYAIGQINKCFQEASKRLWRDEKVDPGVKVQSKSSKGGSVPLNSKATKPIRPKIRAQHKNFKILENPVGILSKLCDCGYESRGFIELTASWCPQCGVEFKRD